MIKRKFTDFILIVATVIVFAGVSTSVSAGHKSKGFENRVAGSYLIDLDLVGTDGLPFAVGALATLTRGGGVVATDTDDFGFGTQTFFHSPKQGAWKRIGKKDIRITVLEYAYDPFGNLTTIFKLVFLVEYEDKDFNIGSGDVAFEAFLPGQDVLDPETVPVATGGGSFAFERIQP